MVSVFVVFMMLLGGGAGNDLLDLISSDVYWKSKDVEITPANIMLDLNSLKPDDTSKATAVRRLMAIRTLGELKSAETISTLKGQLASKEMFVADYAQRAIDSIENKAPNKTSGLPPDRMKADLYMLPEHCGAVAQVKLMPRLLAAATKPAAKDAPAADANADQQPSPLDAMAMALVGIAEQTGNVHVDGITMGVSDTIGQNDGFVTIYVRGKWDREAVKGAMEAQLNQTRTEGEVEFMIPPQSFEGLAVALPSDEFFAFSAAPRPNNLPLEEIGAAIKSGKGKFESSTDLVKTIESVDTTQMVWAALVVNGNYSLAPMLAPFESLTMVGKNVDDMIKYEAKGTGKDADAVKSAVDQFNGLLNEGKPEITREAEQNPSIQPLADFWNSIELKADGTNATGTAQIKRGTQIPVAAQMKP